MLILVDVIFAKGITVKRIQTYNTMLGTVYCLDSIGLLGATFILIKTLNDDFSGTTLKNETLILKVIFFIFTIGYVGQAILYLFASGIFNLNLASANPQALVRIVNVEYVFQMFLDIFPILSQVYIHHRNLSHKSKRHGSSLASASTRSKKSQSKTQSEREKTEVSIPDREGNVQSEELES
jgi:hypothetical protein